MNSEYHHDLDKQAQQANICNRSLQDNHHQELEWGLEWEMELVGQGRSKEHWFHDILMAFANTYNTSQTHILGLEQHSQLYMISTAFQQPFSIT